MLRNSKFGRQNGEMLSKNIRKFFTEVELQQGVTQDLIYNTAVKLFKSNRFQEVIFLLNWAVKTHNDNLSMLNLLGITYRKLGKYDKAEETLNEALLIAPSNVVLINSLANIYIDKKQYQNALDKLILIFNHKPNYAVALSNAGFCCRELKDYSRALDYLERAISADDQYANAYHHLAKTYYDLRDLTNAEEHWDICLKIDNRHLEAMFNLAVLKLENGLPDDAKIILQKACELSPFNAKFLRTFSLVHKFNKSDEIYKRILKIDVSKYVSQLEKTEYLYCLGKAEEDVGNIKEAYQAFTEAGKIRSKLTKYKIDKDVCIFSNLMEVNHTAVNKKITKVHSLANCNVEPIFIVGMPRSGTTLLERIISAHSEVTALGELPHMISLMGKYLRNSKICFSNLMNDVDSYPSKVLNDHVINTRYFVDKTPHNFLFWPLISQYLPTAKLVHIKRDRNATIWSNFRTYFTETNGPLGYSNSLDTTAHYFDLYENYMNQTRALLPNTLIEVDYEKLTSQPNDVIPDLLLQLGLSFEDRCLSPEKNSYVSATASQTQVTQKIYSGSSNSWLRYKDFVKPILT
jgi:tetratricopeptide (TPR) repeat protein